ncbi:MAG: hypothetical protein ACRD2L_19665, partial [Terriglobia bacterium]
MAYENLKEMSPEQIEQVYRLGKVTVAQRNKMLRKKGQLTVDQLLDEHGYPRVVAERTWHHFQKGWENFVEAATREPTLDPGTESYGALLAMWGQVQMLTSPLTAFGEVNGVMAERVALSKGVSPGAAGVIRIVVDLGSGFIPIAKVHSLAIKGAKESAITGPLLAKWFPQAKAVAKEGIRVELGEEAAKKIGVATEKFKEGAAKAEAGVEKVED